MSRLSNIRILSFCWLAMIIFLAGCKKLPRPKDDQRLMACYVDGEKWVSKTTDWTNRYMGPVSDSILLIRGADKKTGDVISIEIRNYTGIGTYMLDTPCIDFNGQLFTGGNFAVYLRDGKRFSTRDAVYSGKLVITSLSIPSVNTAVYSGTFEFRAVDESGGEAVTIEGGIFQM